MKTLIAMLLCSANMTLAATAGDCGIDDGHLPAARHQLYEFSQQKTIAGISRPLQSSGLVALSETGQLLWQTLSPLKSTMVIEAGEMKVFNRDDVLVNQLNDPAVTEIATVFQRVLNGDTTALRTSFTVTTRCDEAGTWQLELNPSTQQLRALLQSVIVNGGNNIESINFTESRGDTTEIRLTPGDASRLQELENYFGN